MESSAFVEQFNYKQEDANGKQGILLTTVTPVTLGDSSSSSNASQQTLETQDVERGEVKTGIVVASPISPERNTTNSLISNTQTWYDYLRLVVFTVYRQLWFVVVTANLIAIAVTVAKESKQTTLPLAGCANAAVANLFMAILIRQDYIKNMIYHACWAVPHSAPLWLRRRLAKVYENGGIHSGAAVSAVLWFCVFTGFLWTDFARHSYSDPVVLLFDCVLAVLLISIVITAVPQLRRKWHNLFENTHRWAGWFGIGLFWIALVLFARDEAESSGHGASLGTSLLNLPAFWMLIIISLHAIYPWLLLRKVAVIRADRLTDHAIRLHFSPTEKIRPMHGMAISDAPIREWHAFAAIPDLDKCEGGATSCIISNAGDWTARTIEAPATHYWMKGVHSTGVLAMAQIFRTVIVMATGSGIGPCLAVFGQMPRTKMHIIWSAPSPKMVFGEKIYNNVLHQDPQALIWDTRKDGRRPDLIQIAEDAYRKLNAEAVFFISNRNLTRKVIQGLEKKGVAAFAPVFDS